VGRKKLLNKSKITSSTKKFTAPLEKEELQRNLALTEISSLKELPTHWMRTYSLRLDEKIEPCCKIYEHKYGHSPSEGWIYTNTQGQRTLYLKISDEEKSLQY